MEAFKEAIAAAKEQSLIFKGKRTKRQHPQSPIPFSISPPIVSSNMVEESTNLDSKDNVLGNDVENRKKNGVITSSSASLSSYNNPTLKTKDDEEDQDIANCLILLAQGHSLPHPNQKLKIPYHDETNNNNTHKVSSRRFLETSSSNERAKAGYYVYQCKTCDKTFPSFQALGGHRASHKKPKSTYLDPKKNIYENDTVSLLTTTTIYNKNHNNKVHECGTCGAEFTSGQALGGHMRRHRGAVVVAAVPLATNTELTLSPMSYNQISNGQDHMVKLETKRAKKKNIMSLDLDLNLPAPEDENRINGFTLKQKHEQEHQHMKQREEPKSLVLSSPTLVDCHY